MISVDYDAMGSRRYKSLKPSIARKSREIYVIVSIEDFGARVCVWACVGGSGIRA